MALEYPPYPKEGEIWIDPSNGVAYQWRLDIGSDPNAPVGKWVTTGITQNDNPDARYLKLDCSNGPLTQPLQIKGNVEVNAGTSNSYKSATTRGKKGDLFFSNGDGTTGWSSISSLPNLP